MLKFKRYKLGLPKDYKLITPLPWVSTKQPGPKARTRNTATTEVPIFFFFIVSGPGTPTSLKLVASTRNPMTVTTVTMMPKFGSPLSPLSLWTNLDHGTTRLWNKWESRGHQLWQSGGRDMESQYSWLCSFDPLVWFPHSRSIGPSRHVTNESQGDITCYKVSIHNLWHCQGKHARAHCLYVPHLFQCKWLIALH